jgi:hypothetical protein
VQGEIRREYSFVLWWISRRSYPVKMSTEFCYVDFTITELEEAILVHASEEFAKSPPVEACGFERRNELVGHDVLCPPARKLQPFLSSISAVSASN